MNNKIKTILTVSILVNVLLLGSLAGMVLDKERDMPWEKVKEGLSPPSQELVARMFQKTWKDMGPVMRQSMDNRKYLADVVRAEEFDPEDFDEAVERLRGVQDLMTVRKVESTKELLIELPKEDRKKLAEHVANSFSWKWREGKRHDHPRPPRPQEEGLKITPKMDGRKPLNN